MRALRPDLQVIPWDEVDADPGIAMIGLTGPVITEDGVELVAVPACPNCGEGGGAAHPLDYFGWVNVCRDGGAPIDVEGPCSRACALQLDYQDQLLRDRWDTYRRELYEALPSW